MNSLIVPSSPSTSGNRATRKKMGSLRRKLDSTPTAIIPANNHENNLQADTVHGSPRPKMKTEEVDDFFSIEDERTNFLTLMASYHRTANRILDLDRTIDTLMKQTKFQETRIAALTKANDELRKNAHALEFDVVDGKTKLVDVETERDCALAVLRQSNSGAANVDLTSLRIELQLRDSKIQKLEWEIAAKQTQNDEMTFSMQQFTTLLHNMKETQDDAQVHVDTADVLNCDLVEKLAAKDAEIRAMVADIELLSDNYLHGQRQQARMRTEAAEATQKLLDTEHAKLMQEAKFNLERAELKRDYEQQLARMEEINLELREEVLALTALVERLSDSSIADVKKKLMPPKQAAFERTSEM
eukprot:m.130185 g.130185  ORF g.130185 m.130185 type:complete len:358 (-) comp29463_c0_seq1:51-1124(-)